MNKKDTKPGEYYNVEMSWKDFHKLSSFIQQETGIKMPDHKKVMLQGRLHKRLRYLQIPSFKDYVSYIFEEGGKDEIINMINVVSTNKSDFFREPIHFHYLNNTLLPELVQTKQNKTIKIWSAGCASGEEIYTIAITLSEYFEGMSGFSYYIFGTDISSEMIAQTKKGIYKEEKVADIPHEIKKKYFLRSKNRIRPTIKVGEKLRKNIQLQRLNFMDSSYPVKDTFDIIFCRNVLIYFEHENQEYVITKLCQHLRKDGIFFLGHSESIMNMDVPLQQVRPTIFRKT